MNKQKKLENLKHIKSKGFLRFLLEIGFLKFGLPVSISFQIIDYVWKNGFDLSDIGQIFTYDNILGFLIFLTFESLFFAAVMWFYVDRVLSKTEPLGLKD